MHVDGRVDGDVDSEAGVVIGADGHLEGRIKARNVVVSGRVQGSVAAERLEIIAGGVVEGDVHTVDLVIEPGGRFNGSSEILESSERSGMPAEHSGDQRRSREARIAGDAAAGRSEEEGKSAGSVPAG
ncbi:MAG: polymer-forming cytoskeletal protein [Wenzhouxiangellaceae bacterium]|nr:polymer-forming cytoskeletal protein [Wenzhouxiangellaceae bacterium]